MSLVRCPNNSSHNEFVTTAHEVHDWVVDSDGNFIEDLGCSEIAASPSIDNIWRCRICGAEAIVVDGFVEKRCWNV